MLSLASRSGNMAAVQFFDHLDAILGVPETTDMSQLTQLLRLFERENIGKTLASPSVTVQSGELGNIQIGSDILIQVRDVAGNTTTEFVSTGVIIGVTPTLYTEPAADTTDALLVDFIHLDVTVENSRGQYAGRTTGAGPT